MTDNIVLESPDFDQLTIDDFAAMGGEWRDVAEATGFDPNRIGGQIKRLQEQNTRRLKQSYQRGKQQRQKRWSARKGESDWEVAS